VAIGFHSHVRGAAGERLLLQNPGIVKILIIRDFRKVKRKMIKISENQIFYISHIQRIMLFVVGAPRARFAPASRRQGQTNG
jgi:hypothetical protein